MYLGGNIMNNIVKSAISTAAGKIFKLKTSQKIAIGAAAAVTAAATGLVIAKSVQAHALIRWLIAHVSRD